MQQVMDVTALRGAVAQWRREGKRVALVPTMGNLHAGHAALVQRAQQVADRTVVSIFVNPLQFVKGEDFDSYPRTPEQDLLQLSAAGVDLAFLPDTADLYDGGLEHTTRVTVPTLDRILCGEFRPGHFTGVATVVTKLLNLTQPDIAVFGDKDYQQLLVIRRLVADLCISVDISAVPTVRDVDGLAFSSRNVYLTRAERRRAPLLFKTLSQAAERLQRGEANVASLEADAMALLEKNGFRPDYFSVRRAEDLMLPSAADSRLVVVAAAWIGRTRLIDHVEVNRA
ncbi:MAG: pantoate--beta-alanine ligase [Chromatiales bacterium]